MSFAKRTLRRLAAHRSGVAMTEFAISLPFLLTAGLFGTEIANMTLVYMKVSQVAMHLADNASRIGDTSTIVNRLIFEADINDLLVGSNIQGGASLNFYERGRAIITSLEVYDATVSCAAGGCPAGPKIPGTQWIHWQRCMGKKRVSSSYGTEGDVLASGIGPAGQEVTAEPGGAVIFVEVVYDYQPIFSSRFVGNTTIRAISSFTVRSSIDLSGLKQRRPLMPDPPAYCNQYNGLPTIAV